ncbi:zona pellucida glycoprotein d [Acipenser ruthenus]|uniref:zona pellucida glycoprotein d n=1 Tax=Acipenser ruthenus TaxID=7906 RepID=UPI002740A025|nr:zona pellucida glycoprotein d [Acipenser ruthenus]
MGKLCLTGILLLCCSFDYGLGCDPKVCMDPGTCELDSVSGNCSCVAGFYGNACDKLHMEVICEKDLFKVMVVKEYFEYNNISLSMLHLLNVNCTAIEEELDGVQYYTAAMNNKNYTMCGGLKPQVNKTHITYTNVLSSGVWPTAVIVRQQQVDVTFHCVYPYDRTVSLPIPIRPSKSDSLIRLNQKEATVVIEIYKDGTYKEPYTSVPILKLKSTVYIQIGILEDDGFFRVRVVDCWASQSSDPNAGLVSPNQTLISDGCKADPTLVFQNTNGQGGFVQFSFEMFRFVVFPFEWYLHCRVRLCIPASEDACVAICRNKRRDQRDASESEAQGLLSYGPIKVEMPENQRLNLLLVAAFPAGAVVLIIVFLFILLAIAKATNKRASQLTMKIKSFKNIA